MVEGGAAIHQVLKNANEGKTSVCCSAGLVFSCHGDSDPSSLNRKQFWFHLDRPSEKSSVLPAARRDNNKVH